jgi:hypothetical protein
MTDNNEKKAGVENLKYEIAQEMGLSVQKDNKKKKSKLPG